MLNISSTNRIVYNSYDDILFQFGYYTDKISGSLSKLRYYSKVAFDHHIIHFDFIDNVLKFQMNIDNERESIDLNSRLFKELTIGVDVKNVESIPLYEVLLYSKYLKLCDFYNVKKV